MKPQTIRRLSLSLLFSALSTVSVRPASFSAEFFDSQAGETGTARFYFQDNSYRFEPIGAGEPVIVVFEAASGMTRLLLPSQKMYVEAGPDEPMSLFLNPFACYAHYARTKEVQPSGTEPVAGIACTKQIVSGGGQVFVVAWWSHEYGFPLKVETTLPERRVELRNLKAGPQEASLFALPADFRPAPPREEEPLADWVAKVPGAPIATPPFEKTLHQDDILRIKPKAGSTVNLEFIGAGKESSGFTGVSFKEAKPLSDLGGNTFNVEPEQSCRTTFSKSPAEADEYVIRVRNGSVTVKAGFAGTGGIEETDPSAALGSAGTEPAAGSSVALEATGTAEIAEQIEVSWLGPGNSSDFIAVARPQQPAGAYLNQTSVRAGPSLKLWTPSDPGEYELRYVLGRPVTVLARRPITIVAVAAGVDPAVPVNAGAQILVHWTGPGRAGDSITLARPGQAPGGYLTQTPVKQGNPLRLRAASDPGEYEVRYLLGRGTKVLARAPLTINAVTAEVSAPATAITGTEVEISWRGPAYAEDFIAITHVNQAAGTYVVRSLTRLGSPSKIRMPKEAGTFEVRYVMGFGNRMLAKTTITVAAP